MRPAEDPAPSLSAGSAPGSGHGALLEGSGAPSGGGACVTRGSSLGVGHIGAPPPGEEGALSWWGQGVVVGTGSGGEGGARWAVPALRGSLDAGQLPRLGSVSEQT